MIPLHIFREYDIRGLADSELNDEFVTAIGRALATVLRREGKKKVAVGHDLRHSSPRISDALIKGLVESGLNVVYARHLRLTELN